MIVYCVYDDLAGLLGICETMESAKYKAALFNADAIVEQELETAVDKDRHTVYRYYFTIANGDNAYIKDSYYCFSDELVCNHRNYDKTDIIVDLEGRDDEKARELAKEKIIKSNSNKIVYQVNDRIFLAFNKAEQYAIAKDASIKPIKFSDWVKSRRAKENDINICCL